MYKVLLVLYPGKWQAMWNSLSTGGRDWGIMWLPVFMDSIGRVEGAGKGEREQGLRVRGRPWVLLSLAITERQGTMVLPVPHPPSPSVSISDW